MSAYTMAEAWAPIEARNFEIMQQNTWGHLAPEKDKHYKGSITYAVGCYGSDDLNPTPLKSTILCSSSPWFYDHLTEWLSDLPKKYREVGHVYQWCGTFCNYKFDGFISRLL